MKVPRRALKLSGTAAAIAAGAGTVGWLLGGADFLVQHWAPLLLAGILVVLLGTLGVSALAVVVRGAVLAIRRPRALGESGSAFAEFIIVIIPFLLTLFALMQLALASLARVLVSYAAFTAARAAIVLVPLSEADNHPMASTLGKEGGNKLGKGGDLRMDYVTSKKAGYIRNAAAYVMIPASPSIDTVAEDTKNNWSSYWENRKKAGLNPLDMTVAIVGDMVQMPSGQQQDFNQKVRDILNGGISTPEEKAAAKAKVAELVKDLPPDKQASVKMQLDLYIDHGSKIGLEPGDGTDEWLLQSINETTQGGMGKFKDGLIGLYWAGRGVQQGMGGPQGGDFKGWSVDRALDAGWGSNTDGAGGALMRALRKLIYARVVTVVTLHDRIGQLRSHFGWGEPITAKVTHLYYCQIPMVNRLAGKPFYDLPIQTQLDMTTGTLKYASAVGIPGYFMALTAKHTLTNQGRP